MIIQERNLVYMDEKILMRKLTDILLAEKLISLDEKVKILKHLKEGGNP